MDDDFLDRIINPARVATERKSNGRRSRKASPRQPERRQETFTALVPQDSLYYYFATEGNEYTYSYPIASPSSQAKDAAKIFVGAFIDAWHHVPQPDQQKVKAYWQRPDRGPLCGVKVPYRHPRPLIQLVDDWWNSRMAPDYIQFGDVIKFSVSAIIENESGLCSEIVKTLATVYWTTTRASIELHDKLFIKPFETWEKHHRNCSKAAWRKKDAAVRKIYEKAYHAEIAKILHCWEVGNPSES